MKDMSDFVSRTSQFNEIRERTEKEHFSRFLEQPMTKLALSMMPRAEPQELTTTLLMAAFKSGMNAGEATCAEDLVGILTKLKKEMGK